MNTTPLWVPLVVAALGIAGVVITQWRSDVRESVARQHDRAWERERWAREDELRNFEARRDAYIDLYSSLRETARMIRYFGRAAGTPPEGGKGAPLDDACPGWEIELLRQSQRVNVYASPEVLAAANDATVQCEHWGHLARWDGDGGEFEDEEALYEHAECRFYNAIRLDLGLSSIIGPDGEPLKGTGYDGVHRHVQHIMDERAQLRARVDAKLRARSARPHGSGT